MLFPIGKGTRPLFYVLLEHILQLLEEALALFVVILFHAVLKSFQGFALGAGDLLSGQAEDHRGIGGGEAWRIDPWAAG